MQTELHLKVKMLDGQSRLAEQYFTSPLKLGLPRNEDDRLKVILMMASAGILKGDSFNYEIICGPRTKVLMTEQSYTKIFDTGEGSAKKKVSIRVEEQASLYYLPCAVIPFQGSTFFNETNIELEESSEFLYTDIFAVGRVGMGEKMAFSHYRNKTSVKVGNRLAWMDHCRLEPKEMSLENNVYFGSYTHMGTLYYYGAKEKQEALMQKNTEEKNILFGISRAAKGVSIRVMAKTAQDIEEFFANIIKCLA